jgi:hypothetical protein
MTAIVDNVRDLMGAARDNIQGAITSARESVMAKREEIGKLKAEQRRVTLAAVPKVESLQRLDRVIEASAARCRLDTLAASLLGPHELDDLFALPVEVMNSALQEHPDAKAFRFACAFVPERVKKVLAGEIEDLADDKAAIATRDRAAMLGKIAEQLSVAEIEEEAMIAALEDIDVSIDRRPDLTLSAFFSAHGVGAFARLGAMIQSVAQLHASLVNLSQQQREALDRRNAVVVRIASTRGIPRVSLSLAIAAEGLGFTGSIKVVQTDHEARRRMEVSPLNPGEKRELDGAVSLCEALKAEHADLHERWNAKSLVAKKLEEYAKEHFLEAKDRLEAYRRNVSGPSSSDLSRVRHDEGLALLRRAFA